MLRVKEIPCRLVTGYLAEEWDDGLNGMVRRAPVLSERIRAALPREEPSAQGVIDAYVAWQIEADLAQSQSAEAFLSEVANARLAELEAAAAAGATAVVQPGGSVRDDEVVSATIQRPGTVSVALEGLEGRGQ